MLKSTVIRVISCAIIFISVDARPLEGDDVREVHSIHEHPFVVSIGIKPAPDKRESIEQYHVCTGTLISRRLVLTAAHCFIFEKFVPLQVLVGSRDSSLSIKYDVSCWTTFVEWAKANNKLYNSEETDDIAILMLYKDVSEWNPGMSPILPMGFRNKQFYGSEATLVGWGKYLDTNRRTIKPRIMRTAQVKILTGAKCKQRLNELGGFSYSLNSKIFFCTTSAGSTPVHATSGDSGGPLIVNKNVIVGINKGLYPLLPRPSCMQVNRHISVKYYEEFIKSFLVATSVTVENKRKYPQCHI